MRQCEQLEELRGRVEALEQQAVGNTQVLELLSLSRDEHEKRLQCLEQDPDSDLDKRMKR